MGAAIWNFFKPHWLFLLKWGAIIGAVLAVILKIKDSGRQAEKADQAVKQLAGVRNANKVRDAVDLDYARGHVPDNVRKFYVDE